MKPVWGITIGGTVGGLTGRKLAAMQVESMFPQFHITHGHSHEILACIVGVIAGGIGGYFAAKHKTKNQIQENLQS